MAAILISSYKSEATGITSEYGEIRLFVSEDQIKAARKDNPLAFRICPTVHPNIAFPKTSQALELTRSISSGVLLVAEPIG
jgi:hypothetical protein